MFDDYQQARSPVDYAGGRLKKGSPEDRLESTPQAPDAPGRHELDSDENTRLHARLMSYYQQELERQAENRHEMAVDEDFVDNIQWRSEDEKVLKERGQLPMVYNVIATTVRWITGTQRRGRSDFRVLPRRKDGAKPAERKTQILKYLSDVNRSGFDISEAFEEAVVAGVGWLECGVQDETDGEPIYDRWESWRNVLWDSAAMLKDLSDGRYMFRVKIVDLDIAKALFPKRVGALEMSALDRDGVGFAESYGDEAMDSTEEFLQDGSAHPDLVTHNRERARLIECWFRRPVNVKKLAKGEFRGEVYDPYSVAHAEQVQQYGESILVERTMMRMHVAIMTTGALLYIGQTPYRHNDFPLTPIWGYRRKKNGMPYGVVRGLRSIQDDINKRASKALYILSTNKVIMEEGAVEDIDEFKEEVSRPDAVIVKRHGKELILNAERELAPAHLELMSRDIAMIQQVGGVTDEAMGRTTNATAGIAIQRRQDQASMATAGLFDNLRLGVQLHGEKRLSLVEQFMSEEKQFRITNMRGSPEYVTVNDGLPENDIVRTKADFVISEADWRASVRQAQTEELFALMQQLAPVAPQVALVMLDLLVESMDLPSREEIVNRIRQVTGMRDPDQEEPTPEDVQREQAQAVQQQMQQRAALAQIAKTEAEVVKTQAQAKREAAAVVSDGAKASNTNVATVKAALEAALTLLQAPAAGQVSDLLLHEAGYVGRSEQEGRAQEQAINQQAAQQQAGPQQIPAQLGQQP